MDGSQTIEIQAAALQNFGQQQLALGDANSTTESAFSSHSVSPARTARHDLFYAWWHSSEAELAEEEELVVPYHSKVRLAQGESVLIDTGAIKPLAGDKWCFRAAAEAKKFGRGTSYVPLDRPLTVEGVGTGANVCREKAIIPIAMEDGISGTYSPAVVPNSEIPALASFDILERRRVLLDCFNGKYYEIGQGGYDLQLSPGSRILHMHKAPTGHPMLPVTQWSAVVPGEVQVYADM
jgi:hypothetical protein